MENSKANGPSDSETSTTQTADNNPSSLHDDNPSSLHDLVSTFKNNIETSDWLRDNTSTKWVEENPELAEAYLKAFHSAQGGDDVVTEKEEEEEEEQEEEFTFSFGPPTGGVDSDLVNSLSLLKQQIDSTGWLEKQEDVDGDKLSQN